MGTRHGGGRSKVEGGWTLESSMELLDSVLGLEAAAGAAQEAPLWGFTWGKGTKVP